MRGVLVIECEWPEFGITSPIGMTLESIGPRVRTGSFVVCLHVAIGDTAQQVLDLVKDEADGDPDKPEDHPDE